MRKRDFAPPPAEADEQKIGHIAAGDQQDEGHGREQAWRKPGEYFPVTSSGSVLITVARLGVDLVGILRAITLLQRRQRGPRLFDRQAGLQSPDRAQKTGAPHHPLVREAGNNERLRRPDFVAVRSDP